MTEAPVIDDSINVNSSDDPDSLNLIMQILLEEESSPGAEVRRSTIGSRLQKANPFVLTRKARPAKS